MADDDVVVFSDNFDGEPPTGSCGSTTLINWTVTAGNFDRLGSLTSPNARYPGNGFMLDMDGCNANATIKTASLTLSPGCYQLSFDLGQNYFGAGPRDNGLLVTLGTVFSGSFTAPPPAFPAPAPTIWDGPRTLTKNTARFTIPAPTVASLVFAETGTVDAGGTVLDNVLLVHVDKDSVLKGSGVGGKGVDKAPGLKKDFNSKSKACENAGKK